MHSEENFHLPGEFMCIILSTLTSLVNDDIWDGSMYVSDGASSLDWSSLLDRPYMGDRQWSESNSDSDWVKQALCPPVRALPLCYASFFGPLYTPHSSFRCYLYLPNVSPSILDPESDTHILTESTKLALAIARRLPLAERMH